MVRAARHARAARMPGRGEILALVERGEGYDEIGRRLGVHPGLAYLIATGLAADGSDAPSADAHDRPGFLGASQQLTNPETAVNPTTKDSVLEWIRARAAADEPMRRAAAARTADPGERRAGEETADMVDVLTRDHDRVTALLKQLATIPGVKKAGSAAQRSARASIVDMITVDLSGHATAERQHLWPAVRRVIEDGDSIADQGLEQEHHGDEILTRLGRVDADAEEFDDLVEELSAAARKHVAFTDRVFLQLRARMPREELVELADEVARTRRHGPTRPHPHAPQEPPALDVAGPAGAMLDKLRDAVGTRPADREGQPADDAEREED